MHAFGRGTPGQKNESSYIVIFDCMADEGVLDGMDQTHQAQMW